MEHMSEQIKSVNLDGLAYMEHMSEQTVSKPRWTCPHGTHV